MSKELNMTPLNLPKSKMTTPVWVSESWDWLCLAAKTGIVLVFIVNSVALGLYGFGLVDPNKETTAVFGAVSIAFAAVVLGTFVNNGVKFQTTNKRRK